MNNFFKENADLLPLQGEIEKALDLMKDTYVMGGKILVCGNGGSASDSEHIVGELMKGFISKRELKDFEKEKLTSIYDDIDTSKLQRAVSAISLPSQIGILSAFANDVDPDYVYAQMVFGYGKKEDLLIAISTSGNSKNVVMAAKVASSLGLKTIALTGKDGGMLKDICTCTIKAPSDETYKVQQYHLPIYHYLCAKLEEIL